MERLPAEYQELSYIESTGTQCIDTGITASNSITVIADFEKKTYFVGYQAIFGFEVTGSRFFLRYNDSKLVFYDKTSGAHAVNGYKDRNLVEVNFQTKTINCNGTITNFSEVQYGSTNIFLFACATGASSANAFYQGIIYSFKFQSGDAVVRDFIPCKRLSDGAIGMYDLVSQSFFGNSGTGSFIAGAPIIEPTWGSGLASVTQKEMLARRARIGNDVAIHLPTAFQRCEYIKNTGRQYINTKYRATSAARIEIKTEVVKWSEFLFGVYRNGAWCYVFGGVQFGFGSGYVGIATPPTGSVDLYEVKNKSLFINKALRASTNSNITNSYDFYLFGANDSLGRGSCQSKLFYAILGNKTVERYYIPCYLKTDWNNIPAGTIGMYDLCGSICPLTNTPFYINAGTGTFTKGPDVL